MSSEFTYDVHKTYDTCTLLKSPALRKSQNSMYGPIDFIAFQQDIIKRKQMMVKLDREHDNIVENLFRFHYL